jgi:hypothetical protein
MNTLKMRHYCIYVLKNRIYYLLHYIMELYLKYNHSKDTLFNETLFQAMNLLNFNQISKYVVLFFIKMFFSKFR